MKNILITLGIILISISTFAQCVSESNVYSFTYDGRNYEVVKEMKTWVDAATCAVERGGYLAEIEDVAEHNAIYDAIINGAGVSPTYVSISNGGGIAYVWIGATDTNSEGVWLWDGNGDNVGDNFWNGEGANGAGGGDVEAGYFVNWGGNSDETWNEPDDYGAGQDCGAIGLAGWPSGTSNLGAAGEWNDIIGTSQVYFVIEYDANAINNSNKPELKIFPNPAKDFIKIDVDGFKSAEIVDVLGNSVVLSKDATVDLSSLSKGVYFVQVFYGSKSTVKRILVN